jgi:type I restriction enzyme S subunit
LLSIVEATLASANHQARKCARLRQSILKWAFEGRLVDQDPTDEPASALLERIHAERATADINKPKRAARRIARSSNA